MIQKEKIVDPDTRDYDPFKHRVVEKPNSDARSMANLMKATLGSGLLAMPLAFSNAGWALGLGSTLVIGFLCAHCMHILVKTSRKCCMMEKKPLLTYAQTCEYAFANGLPALRPLSSTVKIVANLGISLTHVAVCCVYTVLIAKSVKQIIEQYYPSADISIEMYCLMLFVPLWILCQIKHLKLLAPISFIANVLLVTVLIICLYYMFKGGISIADREAVGKPARFPAFLSTVIFAMEGIGIVMPIENNMATPQNFLGCPGVLNISMVIVTGLYSTLGLFGYLKYGAESQGTVTLNLPSEDWLAMGAKIFISIAIFFSYPLQFYIPIDIFWFYLKEKVSDKYHNTSQVVLRTIVLVSCVAIGIALPLLEQIISIVGAFFFSLLGIIVPCTIESVLYYNELGKLNWILWKNVLLVLFGFAALVSGCYVAVEDIIAELGETVVE